MTIRNGLVVACLTASLAVVIRAEQGDVLSADTRMVQNPGGAQPDTSRSSWSGVYTTAQAAAGEKIYGDKCASCHGADLAGIERAPALAGGTFLDSWHGRDLRRLLERIETMPPTAPKSLSPARVASRCWRSCFERRTCQPGRRRCRRIARNSPGSPSSARDRPASRAHRTPPVPRRRTAATAAPRPSAPTSGATLSWPTYGGNLASHRYSPADQITKDNFNKLQIAWRLKTDFLGPRPDTLYSATPLLVDRVLYTTAGMRRAVIALNADQRRNAVDAQRGRGAARPERDS